MQAYLGEIAALLTALCWTVTSMAFESAGKRVGALSLNLIRLLIGLIFLAVYNAVIHDGFLPVASGYQWFWLTLSGVVGFVLGDLFLFRAFILIGARISMLIMALVPPITALIGWITLGEIMSGTEFLGMWVTLLGIFLVLARKRYPVKEKPRRRLHVGPLMLGSLLALGGAVGQAAGLVLSKKGMQDMNAFEATQIRIMAGVVGFTLVITLFRRWRNFRRALTDLKAMKITTLGSFTGPFLGVSLSLLAVQHTDTGVAATLMALTPVMLIPAAIIFNRERIHIMEILGAIISISGVALFFM
jgi:drug/metabolite transporter (DMT)-like permease